MNLEIFADRPDYMIYVVNSQSSFQYYLTIPKSMSNGFNIILDFSKNDLAKDNKDNLVNNIEKVNKTPIIVNNLYLFFIIISFNFIIKIPFSTLIK